MNWLQERRHLVVLVFAYLTVFVVTIFGGTVLGAATLLLLLPVLSAQ